MSNFVGFKEAVSVTKLLELINKFPTKSSYYFLRWTHAVSGIRKEQPKETEFPMLEGQMFSHDFELRWKYKQQNNYELLLLSINGNHHDFELLGEDWLVQEHNAYIYPATETRFPKGFKTQNVDVTQRYFIDKKTATVHFVALTTKK